MPSGGRIGIPFDNDDQLQSICHHLSTHNTSLNRTATYVRDGYDGTYVRLNRGAGLYGFEIKQRNEENPYTNPKRFPVLKYILICRESSFRLQHADEGRNPASAPLPVCPACLRRLPVCQRKDVEEVSDTCNTGLD